jgi:hypothetical protein
VWLAEQGWRVTAVDFSRIAIDKARTLAARRGVYVAWRVADVVTWIPEPGEYDLVVLSYLQLPDAQRKIVWTNAAAAVAPGGTFFLVGHATRNVREGYGGPQDPDVCYSPADVVATLGELSILRAEEVTRPVTTPDGTPASAIDCIARAVRPRKNSVVTGTR